MEPCQGGTVRVVAERTAEPHTALGRAWPAPLRRGRDKSSQSFALGALGDKEIATGMYLCL